MATISNTGTSLIERYQRVRDFSSTIVAPLTPEDCMVQSMPDVSPMRWHLAHTTWFFETFVLAKKSGYQPFDEKFQYLFNSYYNSVGKQFPRPNRGTISRPGLSRIMDYRAHVDEQIHELLSDGAADEELVLVTEVGLHHEQQHQELMLTDIKHVLSCNPTLPVYMGSALAGHSAAKPSWRQCEAGLVELGHATDQFCFDNELPRHTTYLQQHELANQTVTCGEFIEFIEAGGYEDPRYWLSLGWSKVQECQWDAPLYWVKQDGQWMVYTLAGLVPINQQWPVCHVSYFEADAFARWHGSRLPTEFEWEHAAAEMILQKQLDPAAGQFADLLFASQLAIHPTKAGSDEGHMQLLGATWEWTSSSYGPYPGYRPLEGALGEYNGKFMCNQYVLRGGSVATSHNHIRPTYRNFFPPESRWQFTGFRLAR